MSRQNRPHDSRAYSDFSLLAGPDGEDLLEYYEIYRQEVRKHKSEILSKAYNPRTVKNTLNIIEGVPVLAGVATLMPKPTSEIAEGFNMPVPDDIYVQDGYNSGYQEPLDGCQSSENTNGDSSSFMSAFNAADNYNLSDDTFINHILDRHGPNSIYTNKSHFNSSFDIRAGIESTLKGDNFFLKPNTNGRNGYIFEQTFSNPIGTDTKGHPLYTLKVVIDDLGNVITAFPKK